jgi:colicin import membrane protein
MPSHFDRDPFAPPNAPARKKAVVLAVLVHAVLIVALTWGVNWKSSADEPAVQAELWAAVPREAAPHASDPTPVAPPIPEPAPAAPPPKPVAPPPDTSQSISAERQRDAEIAIEKEKKRLEQQKKDRAERDARERKEKDHRERLEQEQKDRLQKEKEQLEKEKAKQLVDQKKAEQERQKKLANEKRLAAAQEKQLAAQREENLRRMQGLAGATGNPTATGTSNQSAGPSGSYGGRVAAVVRPNIVYPDIVNGNPRALVEVRLAPDGTITNVRLTKSSGNAAWDNAVLRALDKTGSLPKDITGRVPSSLEIGFSPKD